jgi:hypothetical protein
VKGFETRKLSGGGGQATLPSGKGLGMISLGTHVRPSLLAKFAVRRTSAAMACMNQFSRRATLILVGVIGLTVGTLAFVPAANAASYYHIRDYNGQCLEITDGLSSNGAAAQQYTCNSNAKQYWRLSSVVAPNGSDALLIINEHSGKCLTILNNSTTPGAAVIQETCNSGGGDYWEDWDQVCATGLTGYCYWVNLGMAGGPQGPDDCCAMHPSGNGSSPGLKIYANIGNQRAYFWTHTVT